MPRVACKPARTRGDLASPLFAERSNELVEASALQTLQARQFAVNDLRALLMPAVVASVIVELESRFGFEEVMPAGSSFKPASAIVKHSCNFSSREVMPAGSSFKPASVTSRWSPSVASRK